MRAHLIYGEVGCGKTQLVRRIECAKHIIAGGTPMTRVRARRELPEGSVYTAVSAQQLRSSWKRYTDTKPHLIDAHITCVDSLTNVSDLLFEEAIQEKKLSIDAHQAVHNKMRMFLSSLLSRGNVVCTAGVAYKNKGGAIPFAAPAFCNARVQDLVLASFDTILYMQSICAPRTQQMERWLWTSTSDTYIAKSEGILLDNPLTGNEYLSLWENDESDEDSVERASDESRGNNQ